MAFPHRIRWGLEGREPSGLTLINGGPTTGAGHELRVEEHADALDAVKVCKLEALNEGSVLRNGVRGWPDRL